MPCCQVIVFNVFGDSAVQKLKLPVVSLSNDAVSRIAKLSGDILSLVVSKIQKSMLGFISIQLDKTDVANLAELCVYVRYIHIKH